MKNLPIFSGFIVLFSLLSGCVNLPENISVMPSTTQTSSSEMAALTKDWLTYENKVKGFSFQYPPTALHFCGPVAQKILEKDDGVFLVDEKIPGADQDCSKLHTFTTKDLKGPGYDDGVNFWIHAKKVKDDDAAVKFVQQVYKQPECFLNDTNTGIIDENNRIEELFFGITDDKNVESRMGAGCIGSTTIYNFSKGMVINYPGKQNGKILCVSEDICPDYEITQTIKFL